MIEPRTLKLEVIKNNFSSFLCKFEGTRLGLRHWEMYHKALDFVDTHVTTKK